VDRGDRQQGHAYRLAPLIEVDNQVVAHRLRAAASPIGQLDGGGVSIREVGDLQGAGAASKGLDEAVAVQSGLLQNAGEDTDGQVPPVQGNHADHSCCTAIGSGRGSAKHWLADYLSHLLKSQTLQGCHHSKGRRGSLGNVHFEGGEQPWRQRRLRMLLQEQLSGLPQIGQGFLHGVTLAHGAHFGALGNIKLLLAVKDRHESLGGGSAHRR